GKVLPPCSAGAALVERSVVPSPAPMACRPPMSAPAQKPRPAPVRMIARTSESAPAVCMASLRSKCIWRVHAFNFSGRLSEMVQIWSETVYKTVSYAIPGLPHVQSCGVHDEQKGATIQMGPYRYKWHPNGGRGRRPLTYDPRRGQGVLARERCAHTNGFMVSSREKAKTPEVRENGKKGIRPPERNAQIRGPGNWG